MAKPPATAVLKYTTTSTNPSGRYLVERWRELLVTLVYVASIIQLNIARPQVVVDVEALMGADWLGRSQTFSDGGKV